VGYDRAARAKEQAGNLDGALADRTTQTAMIRRQLQSNPANAIWRQDLASALTSLGDLHSGKHETAAARVAFTEALGVARALVEEAPDDNARLFALSINLERLATHYRDADDQRLALLLYEESLALSRRLVDVMPDRFVAQKNLVIDLGKVLDTALEAGDTGRAIEVARERLAVLSEIRHSHPVFVADVVLAASRLAELESLQGDHAAAVDAYRPAVDLIRDEAENRPAWRNQLAIALGRLANWQLLAANRTVAAQSLVERLHLVERLAADAPDVWLREVAATALVLSELQPRDKAELVGKALKALETLQERGELDENDRKLLELATSQNR
jgi:tetratricopeptide (TPR) repeat protein